MGKSAKIIIGILVLALLGVLAYVNIMKWHRQRVEKAVTVERKIWQDKTEGMEKQVADLQKELSAAAVPAEPEQKVAEALGKQIAEGASQEKPLTFSEVQNQVMAFFAYLDGQAYIAAHKLQGGIYQQYVASVDLLDQNRPVLVGETDSLHRLFKNMAHLYRVLGKSRLKVAKEVLERESSIIESVMQTFYLWFTLPPDTQTKIGGRPSEKMLYDYSSYFLNTIAGRSYLQRRDSKTRLLTYYYCIRLLDRANDKNLNSLGVDIRPHIESAAEDIGNQLGLSNRKLYLKELAALARKYKMT